MTLSDTKIKALKPREKAYKASDEKWLYLYVTPAGGKLAIPRQGLVLSRPGSGDLGDFGALFRRMETAAGSAGG